MVFTPPIGVIQHFEQYVNQYDMVDIEPASTGKVSQNPIHFTALSIIALSEHGHLDHFWERFRIALEKCEVRPGVFNRTPTNVTDQNSIDDYMGVAVFAAYIDKGFAERFLAHGEKYAWVYNNVDTKNSFNFSAYFGRFPALIATMKFAADRKPGLLQEIYWAGSVIWAAFQDASDQDGWRMSFMMVKVAKSRTLLTALATWVWKWRAKKVLKNGIGGNLSEYWRGDMRHPLVVNLWGII